MNTMGKQTAFYALHLKAHAKIVDFAGWEMPLHYGSQIKEHHQVRRDAGMFDVSHMGIVDVSGREARSYLQHMLANDVGRLMPGMALYTCMLNEQAGVIDDLIVYQLSDEAFRLVINAGTRMKDMAWLRAHIAAFQVEMIERTDLVMLAIQGPKAKEKVDGLFSPAERELLHQLRPFTFALINNWFIGRTGYTGEDGYEVIFPRAEAASVWQSLLNQHIVPCGLGARDTLRLEAGLNLYGSDMDETVSPLESNLSWTVAMEPKARQFIGRAALEQQIKQGVGRRLMGLVLEGPGVIRSHQSIVIEGDGSGEVTSGTYSPTLEKSIGLARMPAGNAVSCLVRIRDKLVPAKVVKPPFIRRGEKLF